MSPVEALREFITVRLTAAAGEIFTEFQQTIVQCQEIDSQRRLDDKEPRKSNRTDDLRQHAYTDDHFWDKPKTSSSDHKEAEPSHSKSHQKEPEPPQADEDLDEQDPSQIDEDHVQMVVKREADAIMVTVDDEMSDYGDNLDPHNFLREFINDRLTAAAVEIFTVFQQTIVQYQEENDAQDRFLGVSLKPQILRNRNVGPQSRVCQEDQLWTREVDSSFDEEEPRGPQIKEEWEELCSSQEGEQLGLKQEVDAFMMITTGEQSEPSEPESDNELLLSQDSAERQPEKKSQHVDSESTRKAELKPNTTRRSKNTSEKPHCCETCGKRFSKRGFLSVHMRTHTGEKPFTCETCGKRFSRQSNLLVHMRTHTGEKPHCCVTCGKSFTHQNSFLVHMRTHTGEKPHSCGTCGKKFGHQRSLLVHMRIHTGEKPHSCITCGKSFSQQSSLLVHVRTHTGEKPYTCIACGKNLICKSQLLVHMRTHTGEKPHSCVTCGKSFSQHSNFLRHMRTHTGEKPFSCDICGKDFPRKSSLSVHMRTHTGEKPFSCETCGRGFTQKNHLLIHMRSSTCE